MSQRESYDQPDGLYSPYGSPSLSDEGLVILSAEQQEFCDFWYGEVDYTAQPGMRPDAITALTEQRFARSTHRLVANRSATDTRGIRHQIIPREAVETGIGSYYLRFPASKGLSMAQAASKRALQDSMEEVVMQEANRFNELNIVLALRRSFRDRHQLHPTRAMFGLIVAYGQVIARSEI